MAYELCDIDTAAAWWTCENCDFDIIVSYSTLANDGNPICPFCDCNMELADPGTVERRHKVVISVRGGVAEVQSSPDGVEVEIIDHDNLEAEAEQSAHRSPV